MTDGDRGITRRRALQMIAAGAAGAVALKGLRLELGGGGGELKAAAPVAGTTRKVLEAAPREPAACVVRPAQTEGPYFVDEMLKRSDITIDPATGEASPGLPLRLVFNVTASAGASCLPLANALVDVWHCDAGGVYSDVSDPSFTTKGHKFLRGYQLTDETGRAEFRTIYPGWYQGRTVHIHFKIRLDPEADQGYEFTSQLYFDDAITDQVHAGPPYAAKGARSTRNDGDGIYRDGGSQLLLDLTPEGDGYLATFEVTLAGVPDVPTVTPGATEPMATATETAPATSEPKASATEAAGRTALLPRADRP